MRNLDILGVSSRWLLALALCFLLGACGTAYIRNPVPDALAEQAAAVGMTGVRFWGDEIPPNFEAVTLEKAAQMKASRPHLFRAGKRPVISFLTISGGGSDGAYGAGLLVGWTAAGNRPEFEIVTGVSTGALIAPFAFLGPKYDFRLTEIYTKYSTHDLLRKHPVRGLVGGEALASNKPLAGLIEQYVDNGFLTEIAAAHKTGRRLLIGTTNLDSQRPVIWDMGKIAVSGNPEAIHLFRNVLLASAAIPGVFPPVYIKVQADGQQYDEMHVDGGTTQQVFLLPNQLMVNKRGPANFNPVRRVYVVRNGRIGPEHKVVKAGTLSIASRSVSTLIKYQGIGDLYRISEFSRRNGIQFRLAYIPKDFRDTSTEVFDTIYMTKLYELGFERAKAGYPWQSTPPGDG